MLCEGSFNIIKKNYMVAGCLIISQKDPVEKLSALPNFGEDVSKLSDWS